MGLRESEHWFNAETKVRASSYRNIVTGSKCQTIATSKGHLIQVPFFLPGKTKTPRL